MGIPDFCMFVIMFVFPNRLILVPLSIIIISPKSDRSFVAFFSHANLFLIRSSRLFLYWTHSHLRHYPLFVHTLCIFFICGDFLNCLSCQTIDILLLYISYHNYLTYTFLNHINSTFFRVSVFVQNSFHFIYLDHHLHFILFCLLLLSLFSFI